MIISASLGRAVPSYFVANNGPALLIGIEKKNCAGCLNSYTNGEIVSNIKNNPVLSHSRDEWDPFDASYFNDLTAVFATSFRKPLDRALSQFYFKCIKKVEEWQEKE
mmetsp:Transcript_2959/g.4434  ORF Transcript_2959/g.4434 Transcript_2959/m.4434 type:complete len:107 (+) Transcript_2959:702-1022(+)|eukprot:CAMPEP_0178916710 /NCGR_PEP_ID=MMETSP0786-20121207/12809_1 /TAXON_ID=186022 /ORGANISM="Thalassionema frauenfeldii, Strain CCMP 1798" /LENGTH=106 /DNA_ID=CAMNT_0020590113 /DNA_START=635 /DNA_END=955 /DNA_ORIENTATION=-